MTVKNTPELNGSYYWCFYSGTVIACDYIWHLRQTWWFRWDWKPCNGHVIEMEVHSWLGCVKGHFIERSLNTTTKENEMWEDNSHCWMRYACIEAKHNHWQIVGMFGELPWKPKRFPSDVIQQVVQFKHFNEARRTLWNMLQIYR